jgi:putative membrane protein
MTRFVSYVIATIAAVLILATISKRLLRFDEESTVLVFALILGAINAFLLPVLRLLTLPLTCLTFGLFALVLNAALFALAAWLTPGLTIGVWGAVLGAIIVSIASGAIYSLLDEEPARP